MTDFVILTIFCVQCGQEGDLPLPVADPYGIVHECRTGLWVSLPQEGSSELPPSPSASP